MVFQLPLRVASPEQPILVGVFHSGGWTNAPSYYESCIKLRNLFEKLGSKVRRNVHLEIHQGLIDRARQRMSQRKTTTGFSSWKRRGEKHVPVYLSVGKFTVDTLDPFEMVIALADKYGWPVKPLDKSVLRDLPSSARRVFSGKVRADIEGYFQSNYRERYWSHTLRLRKATPQDLIIAHPDHIKGLAMEAGYSTDRTIWINKPRDSAAPFLRIDRKRSGVVKRLVAMRKRGSQPKLIRFPK